MRAYSDTHSADIELVDGIKRNDEQAIQALLDKYQGRLFGHIGRMLEYNKADADDLVEETFIRAVFGIDSYQGRSSLSTWLWSIARNLTYDYIRRRERMARTVPMISLEKLTNNGPDRSVIPLHQKTPEAIVAGEETTYHVQRMLYETLDDLSNSPNTEKQQELLIDHYFRGWSCKELARKHGLSVGAVKCALFRGRRSLQKGLEKRGVTQKVALEFLADAA